ncbi:MAG TPA: 5-(carboxyamino)imidazole ribonucleotide mutase [Rhodospirillaceae bacterium]|nr:5-(carboxyamino)imidazole ribonucleotide mutase [Rhodospirillaceae bacterium]
MTHSDQNPLVGIVMGSKNDWEVMEAAHDILHEFGIPHEVKVCSAHRTPDRAFAYGKSAQERGLKVIIAGAGMAAHLAGVMSALTQLPVLGVPLEGPSIKGLDSLLSTAQMPGGIPVATFAIGKAGAKNAGLFAAAILATADKDMAAKLTAYRKKQSDSVPEHPC